MTWTDRIKHGLGFLSLFIFAGAGALAAFTTADSIIRQWPRIALAICGHPVPQAASDAPHASRIPRLRAVEADAQPTLDGLHDPAYSSLLTLRRIGLMTAAAKPVYPRKSTIERTIAAARAAGIKVCGFEIDPDGRIRIPSERASPAANDAYDRLSTKRARG